MESRFDIRYKVYIIGDHKVGKSSLLRSINNEVFNQNITSTIGACDVMLAFCACLFFHLRRIHFAFQRNDRMHYVFILWFQDQMLQTKFLKSMELAQSCKSGMRSQSTVNNYTNTLTSFYKLQASQIPSLSDVTLSLSFSGIQPGRSDSIVQLGISIEELK